MEPALSACVGVVVGLLTVCSRCGSGGLQADNEASPERFDGLGNARQFRAVMRIEETTNFFLIDAKSLANCTFVIPASFMAT